MLCRKKLPWDTEITQTLKKNFKKWVSSIPIEIPKSIPSNKESITCVDLIVFGKASILANCAAVNAVLNHPSAIS